ncbi:glycosyltransferase family 4 protein [Candidatus Methylopumilus universalis]|uniref:glycosyltransferase n=1 Tax=Candidatus Methylopumilus universalis TaxID=2588536 RepID=UPI00112462EA|nr:glycosyltransferase [Candidatus Methylopumilus universalis]QDC97804.1 glycosyltransferase family 4 protein [Candidatus Methylopumilus universalis]
MNNNLPKLCVLSASPVSIGFFFKPHLIELSHNFEIIVLCNFKIDEYFPRFDLPVRFIHLDIHRKPSLLRDLVALFKLMRILRNEDIEIIITLVPKAGLLGMIAGFFVGIKKRVHFFQGEIWFAKYGIYKYLLRYCDKITASLATTLFAVSQGEKLFLESENISAPGKIRVLGSGSICGVNLERYKPNIFFREKLRLHFGIKDDAVVCIFLGRLTADKGLFELFEAFELIANSCPQLQMLIVGPDEDGLREKLMASVSPKHLNRIIFSGYTNTPETFLSASDFLCIPSYREGFGVVVIEAAAISLPAIGTNIYGLSDAIVDGETGLLVPPRDVIKLSQALHFMTTDRLAREEMGKNARERVGRDFDEKIVASRYVKFISSL